MTSARLYAEAFENEPQLGDDRQPPHRYNAACAAALAGCGRGRDKPPADEAARAKLRRQAHDWLRAELGAWAKVLSSGPSELKATMPKKLAEWKTDSDLAGIRDEKELARLPQAERATFQRLWKDLEELLARVSK